MQCILPEQKWAFFHEIPKVDLHRHLEGSLRLSTLEELAQKFELMLPQHIPLSAMVQVQPDEPYTMGNFLSKFKILRSFYRSEEVIRRLTREAILDAAADGVRYMELMFTPAALSQYKNFSLAEVIDWVGDSARLTSKETGIITRLLVSVNRHESLTLADEVIQLALERRDLGIVGINLAGNEADFPAVPFASLFRQARAGGLSVSVHAGEWGGAENVREAIDDLCAQRIGHGVRVLEDEQLVRYAISTGTVFEVCITSNIQTGVVANTQQHPFKKMLDAGLDVILNTDDPAISQITLADEYALAYEMLQIPIETLKERVLAAARAAFLPESEKQVLIASLVVELEKSINIAWKNSGDLLSEE